MSGRGSGLGVFFASLILTLQDHDVGNTPVACIRNHANAGDHRILDVSYLPLSGLAEELTYGFHEVKAAAGQTPLTGRDLSAAGVQGQCALVSHIGLQDEIRSFAARAEADLFK